MLKIFSKYDIMSPGLDLEVKEHENQRASLQRTWGLTSVADTDMGPVKHSRYGFLGSISYV